jgi:hypothetical protein
MARLEALLVLLGGAAMVVRLHCDGCHVAAAACFESEGNRRHFACKLSESLGCARLAIEVGGNSYNFGTVSISPNFTNFTLGCGVILV